MKNRLLSWLMVLTLCLTLLPTAALAAGPEDGADEVQDEQQLPEQPVEETKQEQQPVEESKQEEQEESGDAVQAAQALIDALPDKVTADNADELQAQLMALDEALDALTDEQRAELDMTRYEAVCEVLSNLTAVLAGGTHEHYLCGGTECNEKGHELEEGGMTTFEPWTKDAVTTGGAYYLTGDLDGLTVPDGVDLTLCLNGHNISSSYDGPTIKVEPGATFTLCDCNGSGNGQNSRIRHSGGTNETYGIGVLVGEKTSVSNGAVFNMYGGTISNNNAYEDYEQDGGGVTVDGGTFNLYGGTISNNKALSGNKVGGGVFVGNQGTFNMSGGTITENTAYKGGGVCVGGSYQSSDTTWFCGTFNMSGGSITDNTSGGVYVNSNSGTTFKVSGTAEITGNTASDNSTQNVYLSADTKNGQTRYATPIVVEETLTGNIGVTTEEVGQTVARGVSAAAEKYFSCDNSKTYRLKYDSSERTLTMIAAKHSEHPVCGDVNCNEHAKLTDWKGVSSLPTSQGNYYLTKDVEINGTWQAPNGVNLCLNGYRIIETGDVDAIKVNGNTFTLCDCVGTGKITHAEGKTGRGVKVQGTFNLYGGAITGNKCSTNSSYGSGVYVDSGAHFNMHGGSITGNENTVGRYGYGAGVYVNNGTFNMTGGSITKNTATYGAGVWTDVSFTVSGAAKIIDNSKDNAASNVYLSDNNKPITIGEGGLAASAKIGVTTGHEDKIESGKYVTVATGASNGYTEGNIFSDKAEPYATRQEGNEVRLYNGLPHEHAICGDKKCSEGHDKVTYQPLTESQLTKAGKDSSITSINSYYDLAAGNWYLKDDLVLDDGVLRIQGEVKLCLNGHTIQNSISGHAIFINGENASLTLCDCSTAQSGTITTNFKGRGVTIWNGSFTMYGGSIARNGAADSSRDGYGGAGVYVPNGTTFTMYGGAITGNKSNTSHGGGVYVYGGSTFNMYGGSITGNSAKSRNGGGVYMYNSTVNIYGGSITCNSAKLGGGVYVDSAGKLTLQGAPSITDNTDSAASNVYLKNGRTITLKSALTAGAAIGVTTEKSITDGSYAVIAAGDPVTLSDTDLSAFTSDAGYDKLLNGNNVVFTNGNLHTHAVCGKETCTDSHDTKSYMPLTYDADTQTLYYGSTEVPKAKNSVNNSGTFHYEYKLPSGNYYLKDSITLSGNSEVTGGKLVINGDVNLCLNGKTLSTSVTAWNVTFITVNQNCKLTLSDCDVNNGGTITSQNKAYSGVQTIGGNTSRNTPGGKFTMYGGTIAGMQTGVITREAFAMYGGTITTNEKGVDFESGTMTVGGTVNITGNTKQNLNLYTGSKTGAIISIDATLTQASRIGITTSNAPTAEEPIQIATGATGSVDYTKIFTPDVKNKGYVVTCSEDGTLSLGVHQHSWRYTADEATITATCENTDGGCSLKSDEYVGGTATLKAPEPSVYDGKSKKATVVYDTAWNANVGSGSAKMEYYQNDTKAANVINAGIYTAKLWIDDSQSVPAELTFAIARKAPKVGDFTFKTLTNLFYDGTVKSAEVELVSNKNYSGCGEISATYYDAQGNKVEPKAPGTYTVKISVGDTGENFKATTADLENKDWTFTIGKGTQTITVPEGKTIINNNVAVDISGWATATGIAGGATAGEVSYALVDQPTGVTLNGTELSVASVKADTKITVKATAAGTDYYNETAQTFTVTVVNKTSTKLNVEQAKWTYGEKSKDPQFDKPESTLDDTIKVTYAAKKADGTNGTFEAKAPVNAGSYTVKVQYETVDHIYTGTADFTIDPKSISKAEFTLDSTKQIYDNTAKTPAVSDVKVDGTVLTENTDYTVSYTNNTDAGTATVTITGVGNYKDSVSEGFTIQQGNDPTYAVPQNLKATYGQTLAEVNLPTGWTWDDDSLSVGNATGDSTRGFKATYTPENKNYKTVTGIDVYVKVNKAAGRDLGSSTYKQRFTDGMEQQIALSWEGLPDGQTWSYNSSVRNEDVDKLNGQHTLLATGETLGYTLNTNKAKAGDTIVFTLTASCSNYEDFTYTITVNITDRDAQSVQFENGLTEKTVTYGDANFTVKATAKTAITYRSSNFAVAEVNATTGEVTIKGAGVVTITAEAAQSDVYAGDSAFYTLTVKPMPIPAPKADERTFTYNGEAQTYTLKENEDYYTITGNEETNANENGYTVTVALKDTTNTCWDDKTTNAKTYSFVIRKAVVTVNALNKTAYVGDKAAPDLSNPELDKDYTVSGLVGKDKLDGNVTLSYDPTPDMSKTGELAIKITGTLANDNYTINYADGKLSITNRPSSGGGSYTPTYPVSTPSKTENGSVSSNVKNASKGDTVTITVKPDSGYVLDDLTVTDKNGNELKLNDKGNGKYTFTMPAGKVEVKASFAEAVETSPFADVETNAYYYEAVKWAADKGITGGIGNSLFGPNQPCTRAQIVTFLWRAAGSPEPKGTAAGMTDVVSGSYYEKAVAWAIENGVTTGTTASTFSPNATCTRAQAVTFLARALSAKATSAAEFSDVPTNSYFAEAVAWAAANSVTEGVGNGLFAPHNNCTRAQIVTFLYRAYNK